MTVTPSSPSPSSASCPGSGGTLTTAPSPTAPGWLCSCQTCCSAGKMPSLTTTRTHWSPGTLWRPESRTSPPRQGRAPGPGSVLWPLVLTPPDKPPNGAVLWDLHPSAEKASVQGPAGVQGCVALALFWGAALPSTGCPHPLPTRGHWMFLPAGGVRCVPGPPSPPGSHRAEEPVLGVCPEAAPHKAAVPSFAQHPQGSCPIRDTHTAFSITLCPPGLTSLSGNPHSQSRTGTHPTWHLT